MAHKGSKIAPLGRASDSKIRANGRLFTFNPNHLTSCLISFKQDWFPLLWLASSKGKISFYQSVLSVTWANRPFQRNQISRVATSHYNELKYWYEEVRAHTEKAIMSIK